jgi:uncharacterized protein (TIGR02611 family)
MTTETLVMKKDTLTVKTLKQAKRLVLIVVGFTVILFGIIMLVTPGPGIAAIAGGVAILATEFVWAKKLLKKFGKEASNLKNSFLNNFNKTKH